jgi:CheY-like chemotaxis protein
MELHLPPAPLAVLGDTDRLSQVVSNLLTNAAKYSEPESRIVVAVRGEGERVILSVEDEGAGIEPDMRERIFDLFVQQDQTIDRSEGGLGLGLAIVKSLVEMHGGTVRVEAGSSGKGSRFVLELPAASPQAPAEDIFHGAVNFRSKEPMRVLLVDDNEDAVRTLGESLRLMGHSVHVAHDGETALEAAVQFLPEVALIDIGLPRMDGYEVAKRMRALPNPPRRLFAVTGYGLESDRQRSFGAGFHRHFVKPVDVIELDDALAFGEKAAASTTRAPA